jgi:hypothetical protein
MTAAPKATEERTPAEAYADQIRPLLPEARTAFGSQAPGSPARVASDKVNKLVLEYSKGEGNKMPALAAALDGEISLSGLRRRVRLARATEAAGKGGNKLGRVKRPRGSTDLELVEACAELIEEARAKGGKEYGDAVRSAYDQGVALQAIADKLGISYFALWSAKRSAY